MEGVLKGWTTGTASRLLSGFAEQVARRLVRRFSTGLPRVGALEAVWQWETESTTFRRTVPKAARVSAMAFAKWV